VASGVVDASRCLAWLLQMPGVFPREHRGALGNRIYGCDDCQEACPPTVRLGERFRRGAGAATELDATVDVLALLDADDATVLARWGRWYLAGRDPRWLRRNALIVLGNSGVVDGKVSALLQRYLAHADPILRVHAAWAAARLGLAHLLPTSDADADVAAELATIAAE
jgi:epoxyqueuosine reductase